MTNPSVGQGVWKAGHTQPNGKIKYIDWSGDREVIVEFYDTKEQITLEWDDFTSYTFNERLNQWVIT